jgi:Fe-S-cluster containining protein
MSTLREKLLMAIYRHFEQWLANNSLDFACQQGCATCCTQNVTMTAVEGDLIHRFMEENGRHAWFAGKLQEKKALAQVMETTNEFAERCLAGREGGRTPNSVEGEPCPYLADSRCQIYQVRPFSCRSFASLEKCLAGQAAQLPQFYVTTTTAAQQLIEHVGQGEYWGNMHDVLLALCDLKENHETARLLANQSLADQARARLRKAKPLPGFLISGEDYDGVSPFILDLFNEKIAGKTVEEILNGK